MNRLHDLLPRIIEDLDEEYPVGVLGLDNWGCITMVNHHYARHHRSKHKDLVSVTILVNKHKYKPNYL